MRRLSLIVMVTACVGADDRGDQFTSRVVQQIPSPSKWTSVWIDRGEYKWKHDVNLTFRGEDRLDLRVGEKTIKCYYRTDPTKSPLHLDMTRIGGDEAWHCIYQQNGRRLKLYWPPLGAERPTGFNKGGHILEFELDKP